MTLFPRNKTLYFYRLTLSYAGTWVEFYGYLEIISAAKNEPKCNEYKNKDKKNKISWMPLRVSLIPNGVQIVNNCTTYF